MGRWRGARCCWTAAWPTCGRGYPTWNPRRWSKWRRRRQLTCWGSFAKDAWPSAVTPTWCCSMRTSTCCGRGCEVRMSSTELQRLLAEIAEQPAVLQRLLDRQGESAAAVAETIRQREPPTIVLVARGSSDNAAVYGRYLLEVCNRQLTSLAAPSGMTLYGSGPRLENTVVIG